MLYWKLRLWLIATRSQMNQDPVLFIIKDKASYVTGGLIILFGAFASGLF